MASQGPWRFLCRRNTRTRRRPGVFFTTRRRSGARQDVPSDTIGVAYTPYLKTGIYHPEWNLSTEAKQAAFAAEKPVATLKVIYATDFKMGGAEATYADVAPKP